MTYESLVHLSQITTLLFFFLLFIAVVAYALWPSNKSKFARAARVPLDKDENAGNEGPA
jgi:cytochrome c oxidase cbb3-type subunit 4